jgi:ribosomal protein S18 acetylase RimI-like enzyme
MGPASVGHAIRRARPSDAQAIVRLMRTVYAEGRYFVGDGPPLAESLARRIAGDDPAYALYLVAECARGEERPPGPRAGDGNGAGAGEVGAWLELHRMQPRRMQHVAVLTVAVAPSWRRRGLGRGLLRRGYGWAADVGVTKVSLNVRAGNTAAIALYISEGFFEEGRERAQVRTDDGGFEDNVIMGRWVR